MDVPIVMDAAQKQAGENDGEEEYRISYRVNLQKGPTKKFGVGNGDPNLRSRPRLPGSVVGEPSMLRALKPCKITKVTVRW
jgi:hypothetical protein